MTQGKIEPWQQTLKNRILLENYYLPGELEAQIADFVALSLPKTSSAWDRLFPDSYVRPYS